MPGMSVGMNINGGSGYVLAEGEIQPSAIGDAAAELEGVKQKMLEWLVSAAKQQPEGSPGICDANGAPEIDGVSINFSAEDLTDALRMLGTRNQEARLLTAKEGLENSKLQMADNRRANIEKIEEYARKYAEANDKSQSIFSWISKAFAFLAAIVAVAITAVATVASGGAAAPALVFASVALAAATISMASAISQECGGPPLELSSLLTQAVSALLVEFGVPKDKADSIGKIASGVLAIAATSGAALFLDPAFLSNVLAGSMELGGVDPGTVAIAAMGLTIATTLVVGIASAVMTMGVGSVSAIEDGVARTTASTVRVAQLASKVGSLVQGAALVISGAAAIGSGVEGIKAADAQHDADDVLADKKRLEAMTKALMAAMQQDGDDIKKIIKEIEEAVQSISDLIAGNAQSMSDITSNIGGRATV